MSLVEGLGADEVYDYNSGEGFLRDISKPSLGQGKEGFQVMANDGKGMPSSTAHIRVDSG
jgi:hypothetical protein